ncbi:glycerol-3-phosphate acyltransferase [Phycicoccus sp. MAQZ13P-2]|uniref:glycerol-3-phosphate acyltransferase n=1 Tax=Phycicoccus mangrovi TaxID=2840470 RepID=UPI001C005BD4|nr:glycerol-3-phosphate acyltransferase [Phycicoccus mangrovi]MBT9257900.1 glycerol-3-phosphate acyltransferase [Phycicoccus mangrovi]MBT9272903.1 glycerol-3-phosphate acyltransferase [Phycicoccus mangrovi]
MTGLGGPLLLVALAVLGFLVGSANVATVVARALGADLRHAGSGNPGATNAGRVLGRRWGALVLVLDVLKAFVPTLLVLLWSGTLPALVVAGAVVLGHVYSPFLGGRGGKGVASALGGLLAVAPWVALAAVLVFVVALVALRRVGEASVVATGFLALLGALAAGGLAATGTVGLARGEGVWLVLVSVLVLARHRRNMRAAWGRVRGRRAR